MARIVFTALGSLGDLHPMIPVAENLRRHGHVITFAVPSTMTDVIVAEGFACSPINMPPYVQGEGPMAARSIEAHIAERFPKLLDAAIAVLESACAGADLIVTHPLQLATAITARKLGLRWVTLTVFPGFIPSGYTVPQPHWLPALPTPAGRAVNRLTWDIYNFGLRHLSRGVLDDALETHGLARERDIFTPGGLSPYLALVLTSPAYSPAPPDWPASIKVAGYAEWDVPRGWQDPPQLEAFLAAGEPPVLVTTSTAGERDAAAFFRSAAAALHSLGRRGIVLLGVAAADMGLQPGAELAPGVVAYPYLPFSRVVQRSSLAVHHGGVVTAQTTIRHGRTCLALPATFDQWFNAGRIRALGVGRVLEARRVTVERLADEIQAVEREPSYRERAQHLGAEMAHEDGAARSSEEIERLLA